MVTAQLICGFVFAYAKLRFSQNEAHIFSVTVCFQVKHSVIQFVHPELQNLYNLLEVEFHPLRLYQKVKASIDFISQNDDLAVYVPALEDILVTRVLKQVHRCVCVCVCVWGGGGERDGV